jgi:hypothetical protein
VYLVLYGTCFFSLKWVFFPLSYTVTCSGRMHIFPPSAQDECQAMIRDVVRQNSSQLVEEGLYACGYVVATVPKHSIAAIAKLQLLTSCTPGIMMSLRFAVCQYVVN